MNKKLLLLLALISFVPFGFSQTERTYMARVTGLNDSNSDMVLSQFLRQQPGIMIARTDHHSESILIMLDIDQLSENQLVTLLESQNMHVMCSVIEESPTNIRQKLQSKCYKANDGIVNENEER